MGNNIIMESWTHNSRLQPTTIQASGTTSLTLSHMHLQPRRRIQLLARLTTEQQQRTWSNHCFHGAKRARANVQSGVQLWRGEPASGGGRGPEQSELSVVPGRRQQLV
jgi:hypothetical protein